MDHFISLSTAVQMTTLYRSNRDSILRTDLQNQNILSFSETFHRQAFDTLLSTQGCVSLRIYYGMKEDLKVHAIIVGVDENNQDILPVSNQASATNMETSTEEPPADEPPTDENLIIENSTRCPEICPGTSVLFP